MSNSRNKVIMLGEGFVGKSSLLTKYIEDKFCENTISTIQATFNTKSVSVGDRTVILEIWDTAGQERFHALVPLYYRNSDAAVVVYDICDVDSFDRAKKWTVELRRIVGEDILICLAGNKSDLESQRTVPVGTVEDYCRNFSLHHFSTSAKTGASVNEMFYYIASHVRHCAYQSEAPPPTTNKCC